MAHASLFTIARSSGARPCEPDDLVIRDPHHLEHEATAAAFVIRSHSSFRSEATRQVDSCGGAQTGLFDIRADDDRCVVEVRMRVRLDAMAEPLPEEFRSLSGGRCLDSNRVATPEVVARQAEEWARTIREVWSRRHRIRAVGTGCPCPEYDVDIDVEFVDGDEHHVVNVHSGCRTPDEANWYIDMHPRYAAHEFGHLLGLLDEYPENIWQTLGLEDACWPVTTTGSIMWAWYFYTGRVFPYHYRFFAEWLARTRCCEFEIGTLEEVHESFESLL